jgi:hypothetical protein
VPSAVCSEPRCDQATRVRGLCINCYNRRWRRENHERALATEARRREANREKIRAQGLAWYHREKDKNQDARLRKRYGISLDDYNAMYAAQRGVCAICGREPNGHGALHVDHDHASGVVRGLLCFSCNYAIGAFQDSPEIARRAASYLERLDR